MYWLSFIHLGATCSRDKDILLEALGKVVLRLDDPESKTLTCLHLSYSLLINTSIYYMSISVIGQDEPNPFLWPAHSGLSADTHTQTVVLYAI